MFWISSLVLFYFFFLVDRPTPSWFFRGRFVKKYLVCLFGWHFIRARLFYVPLLGAFLSLIWIVCEPSCGCNCLFSTASLLWILPFFNSILNSYFFCLFPNCLLCRLLIFFFVSIIYPSPPSPSARSVPKKRRKLEVKVDNSPLYKRTV